MILRNALIKDLPQLTKIGAECYPPKETITEQEYAGRINLYSEHFWILEDKGEILAFANGLVTDMPRITDEMFHNPKLHNENGLWQTVLGINTSPKH